MIATFRVLVAAVVVMTPYAVKSQDRLLSSQAITGGLIVEQIRVSGSGGRDLTIGTDSLALTRASLFSMPITASMVLGKFWTLDLAQQYTTGRITLGDNLRTQSLSLVGPSDTRARLVGRLFDDAVVATIGITAPTGRKGIDANELLAARVLGAPTLGLGATALSSGGSIVAGAVFAKTAELWRIAAGGSIEKRASFQPVTVVASGGTGTELSPGLAYRASLAAERPVGEHRFTLSVTADLYGTDIAGTGGSLAELSPGSGGTSSVRPGPVVSFDGQMQFGHARFRELLIWASARRRGAFERDGESRSGSEASGFDAGFRSSMPIWRTVDVLVASDFRLQSGSRMDLGGLMSMGGRAASLTIGANARRSALAAQPFVRLQRGMLKAGGGGDDRGSFSGAAVGMMLVGRFQ